MLLEQLFIRVTPKYDPEGMERAKEDVEEVDDKVQSLNKALTALTAALIGAATAGVHQFTKWDRVLTEFSGKAGMTKAAFVEMYDAMSGDIARQTGANRENVIESLQRAHSLGKGGEAARDVATLAAILERNGLTQMTDAVEAAAAMSRAKMGTPADILDAIMKAAQVGAGQAEDYFLAAKGVAPMARSVGMGRNEMLAALSVLSASAKSLPEGETQLRSLLKSLAKSTPEAEDLYMERTGKTLADLRSMLTEENGFMRFLELIEANFTGDEFMKLTGRSEGAMGLASLITDKESVRANTAEINVAKGTVNAIDDATKSEWSVGLKRLGESFTGLLGAFGKPFATMLKPFVFAAVGLIDILTRLNDASNGILMYIPALLTALLTLKLAVIASTKAWKYAKPVVGGVTSTFKNKDGKWEFGKGIVAALGLTKVSDWLIAAFKGTGITAQSGVISKGLALLARGLTLLAGPIGWVIGIATALGFAASKTDVGSARIEELEKNRENAMNELRALNQAKTILIGEQWDDFKTRMGEIWDAVTEEVGGALRFVSDLLFGEAFAGNFTDTVKGIAETVAEILATIWWAVTNPLDALAEAGLNVKGWILDGVSAALGAASDAIGVDGSMETALARAQVAATQITTNPDGSFDLLKNGELLGTARNLPSGGVSFTLNDNSTIDVNAEHIDAEELARELQAKAEARRKAEASRIVYEMSDTFSP